MRKITVLGAGRVGSAIARDLAGEFEVTVADISEEALARTADQMDITTVVADLSSAADVERVVSQADLVVGAVPGHMGFSTVRSVLEAGKHIVDISFFDEDPFLLDELAWKRNLVALVDCGIAPGCGNIILGRLQSTMGRIDRFTCYVGGLPVERTWPYEYKAVFSPLDVIEEYTRPARFVVGGEVVTMPALSGIELLDFDGVGTLEAFNTDGLRSLLVTAEIPEMKEKTLRYPGHAERMRMLRDSGFFSKEEVELGGCRLRPLDLTARLLLRSWTLQSGEEDLTVMRVQVDGMEGGRHVSRKYELLDRYDRVTGTTSMARTTGYTCTAAVRVVAEGLYTRKGISPPEFLGRQPGCYEAVMGHLEARGVRFVESVKPA